MLARSKLNSSETVSKVIKESEIYEKDYVVVNVAVTDL